MNNNEVRLKCTEMMPTEGVFRRTLRHSESDSETEKT